MLYGPGFRAGHILEMKMVVSVMELTHIVFLVLGFLGSVWLSYSVSSGAWGDELRRHAQTGVVVGGLFTGHSLSDFLEPHFHLVDHLQGMGMAGWLSEFAGSLPYALAMISLGLVLWSMLKRVLLKQ